MKIRDQMTQSAFYGALFGFFLLGIPLFIRNVLHLQTGKSSFAGQSVGYVVRESKKSRFLFCSTEYQPDWNVRKSMVRTGFSILKAILVLLTRSNCKK